MRILRRVNLPKLPNWQAPNKRETTELQLKLITPMFGGGYKTREVDLTQPICPAAIRGHLRHWWHANAGAKYATVQELHGAETALWGGASTKENSAVGKVAIRVEITSLGQPAPYREVAPESKAKDGPLHGYFLFPYQEQKNLNLPAATGRKDVAFTLRITMDTSLSDAQREEVETALKAWIAFGGVGARTRRGCGALTVEGKEAAQWLPASPDIAQWLGMPKTAVKAPQWTTLAGAQGIIVPISSAQDAWRELGRFWARFRKGHFAQDYSPMSGGKWNDYRKVLCQLRNQDNTLRLAKPFLGLPIIYQKFKTTTTSFTGTTDLIFPASAKTGAPNKLLFTVSGPPHNIAADAKDQAHHYLREQWDECISQLSSEIQQSIDTELVNWQLKNFLEFYAAWVPLNGNYQSARMGFRAVQRKLSEEALDAYRALQYYQDEFNIDDLSDLYYQERLHEIIREREQNGRGYSLLTEAERQEIRTCATKLRSALISLKIPFEALSYYAILVADGDRMGAALNEMDNENQHRNFSKQCALVSGDPRPIHAQLASGLAVREKPERLTLSRGHTSRPEWLAATAGSCRCAAPRARERLEPAL